MYSMDDIPVGIMDLPKEPYPKYIVRSLFRAGDAKTMTEAEKKQLVINYYLMLRSFKNL